MLNSRFCLLRIMKMFKLRIIYIVSLVILGVLLVFTVFRPMATGMEYSEVQRGSLLKTGDGWIIQFNLVNREGKQQKYNILVSIDDGKPYKTEALLKHDRIFTFIRRIPSHELSSETGKATFTIYKEGETTPFEEVIYYLK